MGNTLKILSIVDNSLTNLNTKMQFSSTLKLFIAFAVICAAHVSAGIGNPVIMAHRFNHTAKADYALKAAFNFGAGLRRDADPNQLATYFDMGMKRDATGYLNDFLGRYFDMGMKRDAGYLNDFLGRYFDMGMKRD